MAKYQKDSKCHENGYLKNFLLFLCLYQQLQLLKSVIFRLEFNLYNISKSLLKQTLKSFNTKFQTQ